MKNDRVKLKRETELEILKIVNDWIKNADTKANFLLVINLAILGYFLSIMVPLLLHITRILLFIFITFLVLSFYFLYRTINPNINSKGLNKKSPIYFGEIVNMRFAEFVSKFSDLYTGGNQEILKQIYINSRIANFKFQYIKMGYLFAFLSLFIGTIIILLIKI